MLGVAAIDHVLLSGGGEFLARVVAQRLRHREPQAVIGRLVSMYEREVDESLQCVKRVQRLGIGCELFGGGLDGVQRHGPGEGAETSKHQALFFG
jgi:hypothetical protein